jgi:hypothetical protein
MATKPLTTDQAIESAMRLREAIAKLELAARSCHADGGSSLLLRSLRRHLASMEELIANPPTGGPAAPGLPGSLPRSSKPTPVR